MKRIIIVNNNMKVGGVQKSLYNLLWALDGKYDVTLLLFRKEGVYLEKLPANVKVQECESLFRYLGINQGDCKGRPLDMLKRGLLAAVCRLFGRDFVMKLILPSQKMLPETYDCAISFLHNGRPKSFYGGVQDFVLHRIQAKKKVAFLHCDYEQCGANHPGNNRMIEQFDVVAACSEGCRSKFLECLPSMEEKCVVVRNSHRFEEICLLAEKETVEYDKAHLHVVMVSRLTHEKGIERGITAVAEAIYRGIPVMLHIVGGGPMEKPLRELAERLTITQQVCFYGEQENPYRWIKNADLFLLTSFHEAAPMVIEEARILGVPVLTVETTSSHEMVTEECGWVCENHQQALTDALLRCLEDRRILSEKQKTLWNCPADNTRALTQFMALIEG